MNLVVGRTVQPQPVHHSTHAVVAQTARHFDESEHVFLQIFVEAQAVHRLDKHVDSLVSEFIASTGRNNDGIIG